METGTCPLCGGQPTGRARRITYDDVWAEYRRQYRTEFTPDVVADWSGDVALRRCARCGLDWFDPAREGDARFYSQLLGGDIAYEESRWEFGRAAPHVPEGGSLVEVGPARGAFLRQVIGRCSTARVYERNPDVLGDLRALGAEVCTGELDGPPADVVCAFQVLEHVADVRGFLAALARTCAPGGVVLLSVPNRDRFVDGLEPMDCPPHHMTRWSRAQLEMAAVVSGLEVEAVEFEPPDLSQVMAAMRRPVRRLLTGKVPAPLVERAAQVSSVGRMSPRRFARLGGDGLIRRGYYGHTMFVVMRRPVT